MKNSKFISFEGIDGAGKSTQIELLKKKLELNNHKVLVLREPGGTTVTEKIRKIILNNTIQISEISEMLLFLAARSELVEKVIKPALNSNSYVICDRYIDSTIAYQGYGRNINLNLINQLNSFVTHDLLPDYTFLLDIDIKTMYKRKMGMKIDRMEQSGIDFFKNVRNGYLEIAKNNARLVTINATKDIDSINSSIWEHLSK